jgi:hypothetical protein
MKKTVFLAIAMLISGTALAATDHYVLRDGGTVQHLKITKLGDDTRVSIDVDSEEAKDKNRHACSADMSDDAKVVSATELSVKKQIEGEARYCTIKIQLSPNGAKLEPSEECSYFSGSCSFSSNGKELIKVQ